MIYLDTSYIAKCYLNEPGADRVRAMATGASGLASAHLGRIEFWSVLNRHVREGRLTQANAAAIRRLFKDDEARRVWTWFPVASHLVSNACSMLERLPASLFVRAADAIHLTCARDHGFVEIYSNDRQLLRCADFFELKGVNVIPAA
jgi:predicted nucleic acid-binding protein